MSKGSLQTFPFTLAPTIHSQLAARPFFAAWLFGSSVALLGYSVIFGLSGTLTWNASLRVAAINVATAFMLGLGFDWLLRQRVFRLSSALQMLVHPILAGAFSLFWYILNISAQGWTMGSLVTGTRILPFTGPAFVWQMFQGLVVYSALLASSAWAVLYLALASARQSAPQVSLPPSTEPSRVSARSLLVRNGDEIQSVDIEDVDVVTAAGDYAELVTATRRYLVRRSLAELESEFPSFVRVHRSHLVNVERLVRAEPAGAGRLMLHLSGGETVLASRSGARLIRERAV